MVGTLMLRKQSLIIQIYCLKQIAKTLYYIYIYIFINVFKLSTFRNNDITYRMHFTYCGFFILEIGGRVQCFIISLFHLYLELFSSIPTDINDGYY